MLGVIAASPAPVADPKTMALPTCLRGTRATHHATHGALCPPVLISKCSRQFYLTQRERENGNGGGKKKGRARQRRTFVVWVSSFPSPPPFYNPVRSAPTMSTHTKRDYSSKVPCCTSRERGGEGGASLPGYDCPRCRNAPHRAALECSLLYEGAARL